MSRPGAMSGGTSSAGTRNAFIREFSGRHGDWGREAALWLGRRRGRLKLAEWGALAGGLDDAAAAQALRRFGERLEKDGGWRREMDRIDSHVSKI